MRRDKPVKIKYSISPFYFQCGAEVSQSTLFIGAFASNIFQCIFNASRSMPEIKFIGAGV